MKETITVQNLMRYHFPIASGKEGLFPQICPRSAVKCPVQPRYKVN